MAIKLSSLKVSAKRESDGDWIKTIPNIPGVAFKVRSLQFPAYRLALDTLTKRHQRRYRGERVPTEVFSQDFGAIAAEHLLLDWKGFDTPYSADVATELLTDPEYRELLNAVIFAAQRLSEAEIEEVEEDAKNSEPPSASI